MSMLIWVDEAADEAVDLGDPFRAYAAFAEMAKAAGDDAKWAELFSVPQFAEQEADPAWLAAVRDQAGEFIAEYGKGLGDQTKWVLRQLAAAEPPARAARVRAAMAAALADARRRMLVRVGRHAERLAKAPAEFMRWLDTFAAEHRAVVAEALAPTVTALAALDGRDGDAAAAADDLLAGARAALLEASGEATAKELPAAVKAAVAKLTGGGEG
jgi:hypothetical protein